MKVHDVTDAKLPTRKDSDMYINYDTVIVNMTVMVAVLKVTIMAAVVKVTIMLNVMKVTVAAEVEATIMVVMADSTRNGGGSTPARHLGVGAQRPRLHNKRDHKEG